MKKNLFIIGLVLGLSMQLFAQTTNDKNAVVGKSIDLMELNESSLKSGTGKTTCSILENGIVSSKIEIAKFKNKVKILSKEDMKTTNISAYLEFQAVDFTNDKLVHVICQYVKNNEVVSKKMFRLEKSADKWELIKTIPLEKK